MSTPRVAYISEGKLFCIDAIGRENASPDSATEIVSQFGQDLLDRRERRRQKDEWKRGSAGWAATQQQPELMGLTSALGMDFNRPDARPLNIVSMAQAEAGKLIYALETHTIGGLFEYDTKTRHERRLVHRSEFRINDLDVHPDDGRLVCCLSAADGSAHLATMNSDGGRLREITEGDSLDQAPTWALGQADKLIYQSAGIARNQHGHLTEVSPYRVETLDVKTGEHQVLLSSDEYDCMLPVMTEDQTIYYVRRPYKPRQQRRQAGVWPIVKDILMFPVRLAVAIFAFLNVFSMMFTNKPLTTAGGPKRDGVDQRQLFLYGRLVEAEQSNKKANREADRVLVPDDWELVKAPLEGEDQVLATGVGHYALLPEGQGLVYTDGSAVFHLTDEGEKHNLVKSRIIERVGVT